jgi:membrane protease YdiL (CAAX protease family)/tetratricopeptide (TPR) repeat protein
VIARLLHGVLTTLALIAAPAVQAEVLRKVADELIEAPSPDAAVGQANDAALASFKAALALYDRQIEQQPADVVTRLDRCRFMLDFAASYEIAEFAGEISERSEECQTQFDQAYPDHPETKLHELRTNMYGGEGLHQAELVLIDAQKRNSWTSGQLARLYSLLARAADTQNDSGRAMRYSLLALQLDEESEVRLIAATRLIAAGDKKRALEILRSPIDAIEEDQNGWQLTHKMKLLMQAGAPQDAVALYPRLKQVRYYNHSEAADLLLSAGASALAREDLEAAVKDGKYSTQDEGARFRLELQYGTADAAHAAYQAWRDLGWKVDPLGVNRAALFARDPSLSLRFRDVTGVFTFVGAAILLALAAAVPIVAVHYRGLVVRARTNESYPQADWPLRGAWLALSAFLVSSVLALYFGGALDLRLADDTTLWQFQPTPEQFGRIGLASSLLGLALMMPFAASARRRKGTWWSTQWSIGKCLLLGAAIAVALRLPLLLAWAAKPDAIHSFALDSALWQMLDSVQDRYGYFAALWIVAIAAPVVEEFLFRGVLYRAFTAHLRPLWANLLQAALFAAMHLEGFKGSLVLFVLGLTLGTLTRRSGGLLAAMTLHAIFNLIAALIILRG